MDKTFPYISSITREQFLFYEMRTTAKLLSEGLDENQVISRICEENLFQYPTERSIAQMAKVCIKRLKIMNDNFLIAAIADKPSEIAKQICLYAMMKQHRLVFEFMITVIGEKYRINDLSFGQIDVNSFFMRLQEQNSTVSSWSEKTISKIKQILVKILAETNYLDTIKTNHLNSVWLQPILENAIRNHGDQVMLPAFNCFT